MLTRLKFWLLTLLALLAATEAAQAQRQGERSGQTLFIQSSIDNRKPWVGQELLLTYTLFFSGAAPQIEDKSSPEHPALWTRDIEPETYIDSSPVTANGGKRLRKALIRQLRLAPLWSGRHTISGYRVRCLVPNDADSTNPAGETEIILSAPPVTIETRALPQPAPAAFSGAVGQFSLTVAPERNETYAGQPLRLRVTLSGSGNLDTQPPFTITLPEGIEQQQSAAPVTATKKREGKRTAITTSLTLLPRRSGTFRFRPLQLSSFDPETARYTTVVSNELTLSALPAKAAPAPEASQQPDDSARQTTTVPWMLITLTAAASAGLAIAALLFSRKQASQKRGVQPSITPTAAQAHSGESHLPPTRSSRPESIRDALYGAIQTIGIRNPGGLTSKELEEKLQEKGIETETTARLKALLATIDRALYTPGESSPESLEAIRRTATSMIATLSKR